MAITFISPQKRQRVIFGGISLLVLLVLAGGSIVALLPEIKNQLTVIPIEGNFKMPDIKVDFVLVDSDKVKNLEPFLDIQTEFVYVAKNQDGTEAGGTIVSSSKEEARKTLEGMMELTVISLEQANLGKSDPFIAY